ncbi:nuclease harbi1-like protein [Lasius niger]|uniref:Nuclease harbi1-like protein n=1 Tax=Lasius niger TaxID=67767 RepID=A0A0J7K0Z5_LASNI|nr:nuclease harbi1-like protein [Lasius niger]
MWQFPNCIGALDGKHIVMQKPAHSGSISYNYKQTFSIVLMVMVDANYKFIYADIGCNGRVSDDGVFQNCSLSTTLETNSLNIPKPKPFPGGDKPVPFVVV